MATILETRKTRIPQGNRVRRNGAKPSGVTVLHTAESATDFLGPDPGAENVADFIVRRNSYGSYHVLCDSDSSVQVAPWSWETFHDTGTNNHSVGISAAISCRHWNELGDRGERIVKRMAFAAASYAKWLKRAHGITIPARRITRAQSRNRVPGFLGHGESDPGRRTDPGSEFDWALFLREYASYMDQDADLTVPAGTVPTREELMKMELTDRIPVIRSGKDATITVAQHFTNQDNNAGRVINLLDRLDKLLSEVPVSRGDETVIRTSPQALGGIDSRLAALGPEIAAQFASINAAIQQVAEAGGADLDYDRIRQAAADAAAQSTREILEAGVQVDVRVDGDVRG